MCRERVWRWYYFVQICHYCQHSYLFNTKSIRRMSAYLYVSWKFPFSQTIKTGNVTISMIYNLYFQGSLPVTWSLMDHPGNMIIDERTGRLFWSNVIGRLLAYTVIVEATNVVGKHSIEWTINVPVSYSVNLVSLVPDGILPRPMQIEIFGAVKFSDLIAPRPVPIKLM